MHYTTLLVVHHHQWRMIIHVNVNHLSCFQDCAACASYSRLFGCIVRRFRCFDCLDRRAFLFQPDATKSFTLLAVCEKPSPTSASPATLFPIATNAQFLLRAIHGVPQSSCLANIDASQALLRCTKAFSNSMSPFPQMPMLFYSTPIELLSDVRLVSWVDE